MFFYKHMKFRNQARLCLAVFDFGAHIMFKFSRYRTRLPVWEKFYSNVAAKCQSRSFFRKHITIWSTEMYSI